MNLSPYINSWFQVGFLTLCAVFSLIVPVVIGLRLWTRDILRSRLLWGDILIILSSLTLISVWLPIIILIICGGGASWPLSDRPIDFYIMRVICLVTSSSAYLVSSYLCRLSILCIYYELLMQLSKVRIAIRITAAWVIICWLTSMGVQLGVGIQDILFVKADLGPDAKQVGMQWIVYGVVPDVLSCVCDLIVFALPLKSLWGLQMGDRKKNKRLVLVFSVGFIACCFSLVRILAWKLPGWINAPIPADPYLRRDMFEISYPVEITFGIIGASLPMLRPVFHRQEYLERRAAQNGPMVQARRSRTSFGSRAGLIDNS